MSSTSTAHAKSGFVWPFHKREISFQLPMKGKESHNRNSVPAGTSKLRIVGRGGSGSQLRRVSLANPTVLEPNVVHCPRQPPEPEPSSFYRPTGRGGIGSLSTSTPTPLKPPTAMLGLLRGHKRGGRSASSSQQMDLHRNKDINGEVCPTCHRRRLHSSKKLTRILGALPTEGRQSSESHLTFNNSLEPSISTDVGTLLSLGLDNRSSFESDSHSPITFSPPSPMFHPHQIQSGVDSSLTTTSPTTWRESNSAQSHSSSSSSSAHIDVRVPDLLPSHSDTVSFDHLNPSNPDAQCDWLVPLATHNDRLVVPITRATPSKPQSWTGEWNDDIQDVINRLRQL